MRKGIAITDHWERCRGQTVGAVWWLYRQQQAGSPMTPTGKTLFASWFFGDKVVRPETVVMPSFVRAPRVYLQIPLVTPDDRTLVLSE